VRSKVQAHRGYRGPREKKKKKNEKKKTNPTTAKARLPAGRRGRRSIRPPVTPPHGSATVTPRTDVANCGAVLDPRGSIPMARVPKCQLV